MSRNRFWKPRPSYTAVSDLGSTPRCCSHCGASDWQGVRRGLVGRLGRPVGIHSFRCARCSHVQTMLPVPSFSVRVRLNGIPAETVAPIANEFLSSAKVRSSIRALSDVYVEMKSLETPSPVLGAPELSAPTDVSRATAA
ncbi:MAG: hypothetical protein ABL967_02950 [Bryobacteraceae bacterium]